MVMGPIVTGHSGLLEGALVGLGVGFAVVGVEVGDVDVGVAVGVDVGDVDVGVAVGALVGLPSPLPPPEPVPDPDSSNIISEFTLWVPFPYAYVDALVKSST